MNAPLVSIVMSVHNGEAYLQEAIDSMLGQTYANWEFIIVNDGSTDSSKEIMYRYADPRFRFLENESQSGLAFSLNRGIAEAKGKYIARMDDDDIAQNDRLEKQVAFMEANEEVGVLGTYALFFGEGTGVRRHSSDSDELKNRSLFSCQFCHPTVMLRTSILAAHNLRYDATLKSAQDYDLWSRMIPVTKFATLPHILLKYRIHSRQISASKREEQLNNTRKIHRQLLIRIGIAEPDNWLNMHRQLADFNFERPENELAEIGEYLNRLVRANNTTELFPTEAFSAFISEYYFNILRESKANALVKIKLLNASGLSGYLTVGMPSFKLLLNRS